MLAIPLGATVQCGGAFHFLGPDATWYKLSARPDNYPDVTDMNVTCQTVDSSGCRTWTIRPDSTLTTGGDPNVKGVQRLLRYDPATDNVLADLGDYYISFSFTVSVERGRWSGHSAGVHNRLVKAGSATADEGTGAGMIGSGLSGFG